MRKIIKNIFILLLPVSIVSFLIFSYNVIKLDFQFAHQSAHVYQPPFAWQKYLLLSELQDFYKKITENQKKTNLPKTEVYIGEQSLKKLLSNLPNSTKEWVKAYVNNPEYKLQEIELRYRGDNPDNWLKSKKSFRIKTKKSQVINGYRNIDYFPFSTETFVPYLISKEMDLLNKEVELLEVYFNGESKGLYYAAPKLNEMFLRKNNLMPVNIYKGENHAAEFHIGLNKNLFNNPSLWSKSAFFNQENTESKNDLKKFFKVLGSNQNKPDPSLDGYIDLDYFSKFDAFLTVTSNVHHDWFHNMRLILDPWSGKATQLIVDPSIIPLSNLKILNNIATKNTDLDFSANDLSAFLNKNTEYVHKKYKWLYYFLKKKDVTVATTNYFENIKSDLNTIYNKESFFLKYMNNESSSYVEKFEGALLSLKENKNKILEILESNPKTSWDKIKGGLSITIDDYTPISDLTLSFNGSALPKWIGVDINYDNIINNNEPKFYINNSSKQIKIPAVLYSNRLKKSNQQTNIDHYYKLDYAKTRFELITESNIMPDKIESKNFFNGNVFTIKKETVIDSVKTNKFNNLFLDEEPKEKPVLYLSGNILVDDNLVVNKKAIIEPGTIFSIMPNKSIIFKKQVICKGTLGKPIVFKKFMDDKKEKVAPWGTVALIGKNTKGSVFDFTHFEGGSGGRFNQFLFTSMFSIHDTLDVEINNSLFSSNEIYDDTIHIVYAKNISLKNTKILKAYRDAIDIDLSKNILIENIEINFSNNDGLDFMESEAEVINVEIKNSKDKGISVGENSKIVIRNSKLSDNAIGIAVKDKSYAKVYETQLSNNLTQIAAYAKNWKYGGGGQVDIYNSIFKAKINKFSTFVDPEDINKKINKALNQDSKINIFESKVNGQREIVGKNFFIN